MGRGDTVQTSDTLKVLVVNDEPASLLALTSLLDQWAHELQYTVIAARSGEEALRQVLLHDFSVILLDVNMPGMDGFETADAIRQHPRSSAVPILFITAYQADEIGRLKAYQRGAADFLFTPIIPQILRAKLSVFVSLGQKNEELRRQTAELGERTSELAAINEQLTREMDERHAAERASEAKDEFLAMLGHELRNPLSAISSAAALLGMPTVNEDIVGRAQLIIRRQTRQLTSIVNDLLDMSRAMSGKIQLARRPLDIAELISTCLDSFRTAGSTAAHSVTHELASCWVDGDPARLTQIASNLLDNAIKYTPAGGNIGVRVVHDGNDVVLTVKDDGIGIEADLLPRIFDVFVQGASSIDRREGGLGIGLSLAHRLAELHGGAIDAGSAGSGCGSTFTVRLPAIQPPGARPEAGAAQHAVSRRAHQA
jgi:signal transduction histidine kinase